MPDRWDRLLERFRIVYPSILGILIGALAMEGGGWTAVAWMISPFLAVPIYLSIGDWWQNRPRTPNPPGPQDRQAP